MRDVRRILVVKLASLGDLLSATPSLRALRASFPSASIGVLTTPASAAALRGLDTCDEIVAFDKFAFDRPGAAARNLPNALSLGLALRRGRWDALLLLHHLTTRFGIAKYAALALASGARMRIGLDNGRGGWFLTQSALDRGFGWRHEADYWLDVVGVLGARHPGQPRLELRVAPEDERWAAGRWSELRLREVVLLAPGSGAFSRARRWAPDRFAAVGRSLLDRFGLMPVVLSGLEADERDLARAVAEQIGPVARVAPAAPSPQALGAFVRRCRVVIGNDGGVIHVASAVKTPVVAIFGPTNDRAWGPYPADDPGHAVVREVLACAPCIHRGHDFGTPEGCPARTCLAILEPSRVLQAAERLLSLQQAVA